MTTDRLIRGLTTTAVLLVAAIAAVVSFLHIEHLALAHGQEPAAAVLLPLSIDGEIAAASLVMLRAARSGLAILPLARFMLALGVAATLLANVDYGVPFGLAGALISGWPAVAFVGSVEMTIGMVRRVRSAPADAPGTQPDAPASVPASNGHAHPDRTRPVSAAEREFRGELAAGVTPSLRQVQRRMHVGQDKARCIRADLEQAVMAPNGNGAHP